MKGDLETCVDLCTPPATALDNNKEAAIPLFEENSTLLVEMPRKQAREQCNDFPVVVRGGMHQPFEE